MDKPPEAADSVPLTFGAGKRNKGGTLQDFRAAVSKAASRLKVGLPRWNQRRRRAHA